MKFGEIMNILPTHLTALEYGLAFIGFALLTIAVVTTILDYTNKGKHIDRSKW